MTRAELAEELGRRVDTGLSRKRAAHSRGVASLSAELCLRHGLDPLSGTIAGLAHDLCKELPPEEQQALFDAWLGSGDGTARLMVRGDGNYFSSQILHGPAAATLLCRDYGLVDGDILEAVAWHTVGRADMGALAVFVYCADKMDPGRKHVDAEFRARCMELPPREMLLAVVADSIGYLERNGWEIAPTTMILYNSLRNPDTRP